MRGARALARGVARSGRAAVRALVRGAQYVIRAGKVPLRSVGGAVSPGVKWLRELDARLPSRRRFKAFRLRIEGPHWFFEGKLNPWVLIADGTIQWETSREHGSLGNETAVKHQQAFVLGHTRADPLADMLRDNPAMRDDVLALLRRADIDRDGVLRGLEKLPPDEAALIARELRELKEVDEAALKQMIANYRKRTGIPKEPDSGGTVAAGKAETKPPVQGGTGASPHAQRGTPTHNLRYQYPYAQEEWAAVLSNHAEQTVLGDIADKLDQARKSRTPRDHVTGTIKMTVDQAVCSACRSGLEGGAPGILKQFTTEFPGVTLMITASDTSEVLVIKAGKLLIQR
jgi:hypothetical protein